MKFIKGSPYQGIFDNLIWAGGILVILYWLIESAAHSFWFDGGPFLTHVLHPDRHELWMRLIVAILLILFTFYCRKIIGRLKQAKIELAEREKEAQRILENNPAAIILLDAESRRVSYANLNALRLIDTTADMLLGKPCHDFLCKLRKGDCPVLDKGQQMDISERALYKANGQVVPILKSVTEVQYQGRAHLLEAFFDISEQKKTQQALHQAHNELDQIFQTATVGMRLIDQNYTILKVNQTFSKLTGVKAEEAVGSKCYEVFAGNMCRSSACPLLRVFHGQEIRDYEVSKIRSDGSILTCNLTVSKFEGAEGVIGIVEAFQDITELKNIQEQILAERDRLHRILFHQPESVGIITENYLVEYQNEALKRRIGRRNRVHCYEIFRERLQPCEDCLMKQAHDSINILRLEFESKSGRSYEYTYTPFTDNDGQKKVVISQRDVTEVKASKITALSSERLAALGELAAGVAHEINNPINGIINYAQMLVNKTGVNNELGVLSGKIIKEGDRVAAIVASLLSFSRRENENRIPTSPAELIQETLVLTGAQLRKDNIGISLNIEEKLPPILSVPQEIIQVFLNIVNNSRYALNEKFRNNEGRKKLDIDMWLITGMSIPFVRTVFTDYGTGIPAAVIEKIINPFFSTKPKGKGTGLGLTISYRIIENHGGKLLIESEVGNFTRITVDLPAQLTLSDTCNYEKENISC